MKLEELDANHEQVFLAMIQDYQAHSPNELAELYPKPPLSSADFVKFVSECQMQRLDWRPGPRKVSITRYVLSEPGGPLIASGLMRFPLDNKTEVDGGNLFCDVPPSQRGHGNGSYCLSLLLFEAVRAGLRRVMVTCRAADPAARKVIEKNRGQLQDVVKSKNKTRLDVEIARYWISFART